MSNRIDFFQAEQANLAIPAASISIYVDGLLCPYLEVLEVVRGSWPELGWAKLRYNPAGCEAEALTEFEQIESLFAAGMSISIRRIYNGNYPGSAALSLPVFVGQIETITSKMDSQGEVVEILARDAAAILEKITVYGQRVESSDGAGVFLAGSETCFNENGEPNATQEPLCCNGKSYTIFCTDQTQAKYWSYAEIIHYLLNEHLPAGKLLVPDLELLEALTSSQTARDFDVTGLNLLQALHSWCERMGLAFNFVPALSGYSEQQEIIFYQNHTQRMVELNCQPAGETLSISKTNVSKIVSRKNYQPVTHRYIAQGDYKIYEATFDLIKAWDPNLEGYSYEQFSPSMNPDFYKVRDVYRKWCLNEAGDYSGSPYNRGDVFDFSVIFDGDAYAARRRRFWPTLTADKQGISIGYFLQVSFDNGVNWWQYLYAFDILADQCGIWLSSDMLDVDTWVAVLKGVLKFRITASVISDQRLSCEISDGAVNSTAAVIDHVYILPNQFKYRKVTNQSIFAAISDDSLGQADEIDDTTALYEYVRKRMPATSGIISVAEVQTPFLTLDYQVADKVISTDQSRDISGTRSDNRSTSIINRVHMDFEKQCTNLKIVRRRIYCL